MPTHDIWMSMPAKPIKNVDVTFDIWSGRKKLGTLGVSKGSLDWTPAGSPKPRRITWESAAILLEDNKQALRLLAGAKTKRKRG
jgi:hypothetical protein